MKIADEAGFRDRVATVDAAGRRVWIHPRQPKGRLYSLRSWLTLAYLMVFFGLPFVRVNGHPLFLFNVPARQFILFGQVFWPQDFFIFAVGLLVFIVFIALFTVVYGRVFCGWACPQTIFMEMVFRRIEYWIEGDGPTQKKLKSAPWTVRKIVLKFSKWTLFWILSFIIANTFLAYVIGVESLREIVTGGISSHPAGFAAMTVFTSVFFFVYSWFREQVCTVVCPYGRLQGVLLDKHSIVVAYDAERGEPRGKFKKNTLQVAGDCIDCHQCVQVCPTGIDIRQGTQLECINCTACIDACNRMMDAVGRAPDLIGYASEAGSRSTKIRFRTKAYSVVMVALLALEALLLATRSDLGASVVRTPGQLYQEQANGQISNLYNIKLVNKTFRDTRITLKPEGFDGRIGLIGAESIRVPAGKDAVGEFFIFRNAALVAERKTSLRIGIYEGPKRLQTIELSFVGPFRTAF